PAPRGGCGAGTLTRARRMPSAPAGPRLRLPPPDGVAMSTRTSIIASLVVLLAACASLQPDSGGPAIAGDGTCNAEGLGWAIGEEATRETMARVWRESGAGLIR